jgi:hypothetical protein
MDKSESLGQESLHTVAGSTNYICSAAVIEVQNRVHTLTSPTAFQIVKWKNE